MLIDLTPPVAEPMASSDAALRAQLRLDPGETEENALIDALCATARAHVEALTGRRLITQTARLIAGEFPGVNFSLPVAPVSAIAAIKYTNAAGELATLAPADYRVTQSGPLWGLAPAYGKSWPALRDGGEVQIDITVGFGADLSAIPADLAQAMRLIVAHLFQNREAVSEGQFFDLPIGVRDMCARWRVFT